jgi:hypothetical protein
MIAKYLKFSTKIKEGKYKKKPGTRDFLVVIIHKFNKGRFGVKHRPDHGLNSFRY